MSDRLTYDYSEEYDCLDLKLDGEIISTWTTFDGDAEKTFNALKQVFQAGVDWASEVSV